jgi:hypothetical protein
LKTIAQLLVAALVIIACAKAGNAAWRYYSFHDAVEQEARFGEARTTAELHQRLMELAEARGIPLEEQDLVVERRNQQTFVAATYIEPIELVPALYTREQQFELELTVRPVRPLTDSSK